MTDGREVTRVIDAEGGIVQSTLAAPRITVSYSRKIAEAHGLPQYENAEAYAAVQADVALDGSDRHAAIADAFAIAKSAVLTQLGVESTVSDDNVVIEKLIANTGGTVVASKPKAPAARRGSTGTTGPKKDQAALWAELSSDPSKYFDNRNDKRSDAAPDFKRKGTGEGLWLVDRDGTDNVAKYGVTLP